MSSSTNATTNSTKPLAWVISHRSRSATQSGGCSRWHADAEWIEPDEFPNGGRRQGPARRRGVSPGVSCRLDGAGVETTPYRKDGDIVIVHEVSCRLIDGTAQQARAADVFTLHNGQIIRMRAYADPAEVVGERGNRGREVVVGE